LEIAIAESDADVLACFAVMRHLRDLLTWSSKHFRRDL
jgi:hypothetical protein